MSESTPRFRHIEQQAHKLNSTLQKAPKLIKVGAGWCDRNGLEHNFDLNSRSKEVQLWRKRHEKGPDTNVRWVVGNLKVKGTKDCILRLQFLGGNSRLIKLDKSDLCFFSSQPANLKIWQH